MAFIEVNNLKYRYPHAQSLAIDGLCLDVDKGQFIGIAGSNKAGKSTLCQAFAGLVPTMFKGAYGGYIKIDGMEAARTPVSVLCRKVGMVFQNPFNQLSGARDTVWAEIAFGLQNTGVPRAEIRRRVEVMLELLKLEPYRNRNPFDLSGGQTQKVAVASILAMQPEVIVLDEPTSQLDPESSDEIFLIVEELTKTGVTVIMAEHKMEKLAAYCDKILLLHEGRPVCYDTPERVCAREDLDSYGVVPPVYTQICRALHVKCPDGFYPVTQAQVLSCKAQFPKETVPVTKKRVLESEPEPVFQVHDMMFSYQEGLPVIQKLNLLLDTRPTAVIGQNGAGKTTLAKLLKGLLKPVEGTILCGQEDLSKKTVAGMAGIVGYVFQNPDDQIFKNRVLDEVMVGPLNLGKDKKIAGKLAMDALGMVGLQNLAMENPYDLDLAERKMVAIASVLAMDTKVLILDEPTIGQDAKGRAIIGGLVKSLSGQGKSVIAILHDMDFAAEYFSRIIVMAHGQVLADGTGEEVFSQSVILKEACLEPPHITALCRYLGYQGCYMTVDEMIDIKNKVESF